MDTRQGCCCCCRCCCHGGWTCPAAGRASQKERTSSISPVSLSLSLSLSLSSSRSLVDPFFLSPIFTSLPSLSSRRPPLPLPPPSLSLSLSLCVSVSQTPLPFLERMFVECCSSRLPALPCLPHLGWFVFPPRRSGSERASPESRHGIGIQGTSGFKRRRRTRGAAQTHR